MQQQYNLSHAAAIQPLVMQQQYMQQPTLVMQQQYNLSHAAAIQP